MNQIQTVAYITLVGVMGLSLAWPTRGVAAEPEATPLEAEELGALDIEQLANIKVTLASRTPIELARTAAAVSVVSSEDIERDGAPSLPEALRLVPGMQVARMDAGRYAISIRGFNEEFGNRLLMMQDGRALYTPAFGGVLWEVQDALLEDLKRIEVVRGPSGMLWGTRAVNGVVNIESKHARDTQGWLLVSGVGNEERTFNALRYGGSFGDAGYYRIWGKRLERDNLGGGDHSDGFAAGRLGFRGDYKSGANSFMLNGEVHRTRAGRSLRINTLTPPFVVDRTGLVWFTGGAIAGEWTRSYSPSAQSILHLAYDQLDDDARTFGLRASLHTARADFQHSFAPFKQHRFTWGLAYEHYWDKIQGGFVYQLDPAHRQLRYADAFVRDDVKLLTEHLWLKLGAGAGMNTFTSPAYRPSASVAWLPTPQQLVWVAATRTQRLPTRAESDANVVLDVRRGPIVIRTQGSDNLPAESVTSYQAGYRQTIDARLALDVAAFDSHAKNIVGLAAPHVESTMQPPQLRAPFKPVLKGRSWGGEASVLYNLSPRSFARADYTYLRMNLEPVTLSFLPQADRQIEASNPRQQIGLRSGWAATQALRLDGGVFYVSALPALQIPPFWDLHARIAWRPLHYFELSLVGRHLINTPRPEFASFQSPIERPTVEPSVFLKTKVEL